MKLVLEVRLGPCAGRSFVIEPGLDVIVGRAAPSQLILADDPTVSRRHFAIRHDGRVCQIRDLSSSHGTTVNGALIDSAVVTPGDLIGAGTTLLWVRFAETAPATAVAIASPSQARVDSAATLVGAQATAENNTILEPTPHDGVLSILNSLTHPLYAILDAARDPLVYQLVHACPDKKQSLYEGPQASELAFVAPYLVALPKESPFLERLVREGWGKSWGVYLTCEKPFEELRKDLRRFLTVELEGGKKVLFRYYDPRVLSTFLPTCRPSEASGFFRDVRLYLCERGDGALERFSVGKDGLQHESIRLDS
jgi:Domain of unknown function (DUF4123)/FHA domain